MFHYTTSSILHCCAQHKHFKARLRCTYICSASILALPSWEYKSNSIYLKSSFDLALKGERQCHLLLTETQSCDESLYIEESKK